jgi:hypothetical protein
MAVEYDDFGNVKPSTDYPMHKQHATPRPCSPGSPCPYADDISGMRRAIEKHEARLNNSDVGVALLKQQMEYVIISVNGLKTTVERVAWIVIGAVVAAVLGLVVAAPKLVSTIVPAVPHP